MSDSRDNAFLRSQDAASLQRLVEDIASLRQQVEELRSAPQRGLYLPCCPRQLPPISASGVYADFPLPKKYGGLLGFGGSVFVSTTNNVSNYWVLDLISVTSGLGVATFNTSLATANTWVKYFTKTVINAPSATVPVIYVYATKIGSPGVLFPDLYVSIL